ncbi:MAG: FAD-dependent thymidylate synthase [bacterium]|nr:FAD-dependent thymidylate synthase [bacterium]
MKDESGMYPAERVERASVPALDERLGVAIPVLGGQCFIRPVDYMGNDAAIVQAARVSYGKGTKKISTDRGLIRYLLRKYHTTPFEMCELKIHALYPMDVWRQWIRHRTASVNEYSTRASEALENLLTPANGWRLQDQGNKMGSDGFLPEHNEPGNVGKTGKLGGEYLTAQEEDLIDHARAVYQERLDAGIAKEQARKDLPLSTFSMAYWKIDLHNLLHFLRLRLDAHAQLEIRLFAQAIAELVKVWVPHTWEAFEDYRLYSLQLTRLDKEMLRAIVNLHEQGGPIMHPTAEARQVPHAVFSLARDFGWLSPATVLGTTIPKSRERDEFEVKLMTLTGWEAPWRA